MTKTIYGETWNEVIAEMGITEKFKTTRGVRQGCPLSPTLFNIEDIAEAWEKKNERGLVIGGETIFIV